MKIGVSITPCAVCSRPRRARVFGSLVRSSKCIYVRGFAPRSGAPLRFLHFAHAGGVSGNSPGVKRAGASATPGCLKPKTAAPWKGCEESSTPLQGAGFLSCPRIPGVRKKRVPLANFRAPLRGASRRRLKSAPTKSLEITMTLPLPIEIYLICFGAGSVIHAAQALLVEKLRRHRSSCDRVDATNGLAIALTTFFREFGNFLVVFAASAGFGENTGVFRLANFVRDGSLVCFRLLFSYVRLHVPNGTRRSSLPDWYRYLRYLLWPWTVFGLAIMAATSAGFDIPTALPKIVGLTTLHMMLLYFVIFTVTTAGYRSQAEATGVPSLMRAQKAGVIAGVVAI